MTILSYLKSKYKKQVRSIDVEPDDDYFLYTVDMKYPYVISGGLTYTTCFDMPELIRSLDTITEDRKVWERGC